MKTTFNFKINNVTISGDDFRANIGNIEMPINFECEADETETMYRSIASYAKEIMKVVSSAVPANFSFNDISFNTETSQNDEVSSETMKAAEKALDSEEK